MEILLFFITIALITLATAKFHVAPFFTLILAALFFGTAAGVGETVTLMRNGAGNIFGLLGIPVFCGALIAMILRQEGMVDQIVRDMRLIFKREEITAAAGGYLLSIPLMCCLTSFVVISPLIEQLGRKHLFYMAAFGSIISFVLLFPLPVVYSIAIQLGVQSLEVNMITIPLSFVLLGAVFLLSRPEGKIEVNDAKGHRAWIPILLPILLILLFRNVYIALMLSLLVSLLLVKDREIIFEKGTRNAGIIMLDLCGAGAFGAVITGSAFAEEVFLLVDGFVPAVLIPFVLAALIQTAQGSRVVTAVVTASIVTGQSTGITTLLMISAGTMVFSYVTDPYFWLVRRATGDDIKQVFYNFTLPLACAGLFIVLVALGLDHFNVV